MIGSGICWPKCIVAGLIAPPELANLLRLYPSNGFGRLLGMEAMRREFGDWT
jgi:hypothetical protein